MVTNQLRIKTPDLNQQAFQIPPANSESLFIQEKENITNFTGLLSTYNKLKILGSNISG